MKNTEDTLNKWRLLLEEKKHSKLNIKEFCKEKNVTPSQFYYYQEIIMRSTQSKESIEEQKVTHSNIEPIRIINNTPKKSGTIRFILPNKLQCVFPQDMSPHEMKSILALVMPC